ncbi:MAG TPA: hypothetical protein VMT85_14725 [Thermoanaerobaculia bacterium]|nr:hypothetical protein [Thermoanaerobaculia bacterium]
MKSVLAIVAGFVVWTAIYLGSNQGIVAAFADRFAEDGSTRDPAALLLVLLASVVASFVAGWVNAALAPSSRLQHGLVLGAVNLLVGIAVQSAYWTTIPLWFHVVFLALLVPVIVFGSWVRARRGA